MGDLRRRSVTLILGIERRLLIVRKVSQITPERSTRPRLVDHGRSKQRIATQFSKARVPTASKEPHKNASLLPFTQNGSTTAAAIAFSDRQLVADELLT